MNRSVLPWWAVTGAALTTCVGLAGGQLAAHQGASLSTCVMVGASAAAGFAGLWIAASTLVHTVLRNK